MYSNDNLTRMEKSRLFKGKECAAVACFEFVLIDSFFTGISVVLHLWNEHPKVPYNVFINYGNISTSTQPDLFEYYYKIGKATMYNNQVGYTI